MATSSTATSRSPHRFTPIPYREGPLDYEPAVMCDCGEKAARWISWSEANPGRRYLKCYRARDTGCNFWRWYDDKPTEFQRQLLTDLRVSVFNATAQLAETKERLADAIQTVSAKYYQETESDLVMKSKEKEVEALVKKVAALEKKNDIYKFIIVVLSVLVMKWVVMRV